MAWVLSAVLVAVLLVTVAIMQRRIATLRAELRMFPDGPLPAAAAATPAATPVTEPATPPSEAPAPPSETPPAEATLTEPAGVAATPATEPSSPPSEAPAQAPAAAAAAAGPAEPAPSAGGAGRLPSLWALTLLEQRHQWQLSGAAAAPLGQGAPDDLPSALDVEVERIREEVGTPGSVAFDIAMATTADDAAVIFQATRQLLALLVPHTQAFDLVLHAAGGQAVIELTCSGWEGPDQVADGVGRLLEAVAPAGGDLELDMLPGDRLQATLRLPLDPPAV